MASGGAATSTPAAATGGTSKTVSASLWWDSFVVLSDDLDRAAAGPSVPDALAKRIKSHHAWLLRSVSMFGKPNEASRSALDASEVAVGEHRLAVKPELMEAALRVSKCLNLDEVQSYILVKRSSEISPTVHDADADEFLHLVSVQYYLERQCLLKCIRRIFVHATHTGDGSDSTDAIQDEASLLISEEVERKLISVIEDSFSAASSVRAEAEFTVSSLEETLIEVNLILDILFLAFYDNFSRCNGGLWISLCSLFKDILCGSYDVGKFAVSVEAKNSFHYAKAQLLLILIETLDFENLLRMIRDEVPLSVGCSTFSVGDILEMDVEISKIPEFLMVESGPLVLAWAVFLCLVLSLPESNANLEIDHTLYARRAFEFAPFNYLLGVLCSSIFRESDGPVSGYRGILRTFISAFIASYEISQAEDSSLDMISSILYEVYDGEESLCMQFWDKNSFVDGPIRSVLHMVEKEYPFQISELVRFLSAVCHGTWPAQCVYNYLERMNGVTTIYAIPGHVAENVNYGHQIESHHPVSIPGIEGIKVPCGTNGYILKVLQGDAVLVRWEFPHSGVFLLLVTLAQELHSCNYKEASDIMDLLYRMVSSNKDLCFALLHVDKSPAVQKSKNLGQLENHVRIDIAKIFCNSIFKYVQDVNNADILSKTLGLLAEMIKCAPYHVFDAAFECNIFTSQLNGPSSDWLLSGALARMLFAASEGNGDCSLLTTSVLDFATQVLRKGAAADDIISPLIVFSIQYIMVNHMNWKYKKYSRWKTTLRVFELVKTCIHVKPFSSKLGGIIWEILLYDSSVHSVLWSILSLATQLLEHSYRRNYHGLKDIEDIELVLCNGLDIIYYILSKLPEDLLPYPPFVTMVLSSSLKPFTLITALTSLLSFRNSDIQVAAARALSVLCLIAYKAQPQLMENVSFTGDVSEIQRLQATISSILDEEEKTNDCLVVAVFNLLTSAARYQPAFLNSLMEQSMKSTDHNSSTNNQNDGSSVLTSKSNAGLVDQILDYIVRSIELMNRSPSVLLSILDLLKALWESGIQFLFVLEKLRSSITFWDNLSRCIRATLDICPVDCIAAVDENFSLRYHCQGKIFEIMSHELFLQGKLLAETSNPAPNGSKGQKEHSAPCRSSVVLKWFDTAILDDLISHLSSNAYNKKLLHRAKVAACLCTIHLITKLSTGDTGSLSFSVVKKIQIISTKLSQHHSFSALQSQYCQHGYSGEQELNNLIINDLYHHIRGELEGRQISSGPFQELLSFLLEFKLFEHDPLEQLQNTCPVANANFLFNVEHIHDELGVDLWISSDRKSSKEVAEEMLDIMHKSNLMKCYADAKLSTLKSFLTFLSVYTGASSNKNLDLPDGGISTATTQSAVKCACKSFQSTVDSLLPQVDTNEVLFPLLSGQVELLLTLARILFDQAKQNKKSSHLYPDIVLLMKTSVASTSFLVDLLSSTHALKQPVKALLVLLLSSYEFMYSKVDIKDLPDNVNIFGELAVLSVSLLPVLCKLAENREFSDLAVASMDLILKGFVPSEVCVPILQKHFHLQAILHRCQHGGLLSTQVILNFLLTLGRTKDGATVLQSANIFAFLKVLLSQLSLDDSCLRNSLSAQVKDVNQWGLGLAIVASLNHCLDDDISRNNVANSTISFLSGQVPLMSSYLSAQSVTAHQNKKRALSQKSQTSLSTLSLTENILILLCILAKYHFPRDTGKKEVDSELREIIIHLLAFVSKGSVKASSSSNWNSSFFCPAVVKEELALNEKPPHIRSKHGWFKFAASCTLSTSGASVSASTALPLVIRDKSSGDSDSVRQTRFTEMLAVQIYRIAFLIMKFLCSQAKEAVKRAEELEFLDLAHFPELPMPDILHGLQDQVVSIVTEVFEANGSSTLNPETERVCHLLLVTLEMSLYMELCVSQSCGIRPVLGRFEDFCKGIKAMLQAIEKHSSFKALARSLTQITTLLYPTGRETPLHLAVRLGDVAAAEMLMAAGADWSLQNEQGWSALQEAICAREESLARVIVRHYQPLAWAKWCRRLPRVVAAMRRMRDFYMEITFHFESSVIPFISRIAPSDTYRVWKRGANLRADMTLAGFDGFKIQRSDQTILFLGEGSEDGKVPPGSLLMINHKDKEIMNALEGAGAPASEAEVQQEVTAMSQTNIFRPGIDVTQAVLLPQLTWRRQERAEAVGPWKAKVYDMHHVVVSVKSRRVPGAMTDEEFFSACNDNDTESEGFEDVLTEEEKKQLEAALKMESPDAGSEDQSDSFAGPRHSCFEPREREIPIEDISVSGNGESKHDKKGWFSNWGKRSQVSKPEGMKKMAPPRSSLCVDEKVSDLLVESPSNVQTRPGRHSVDVVRPNDNRRIRERDNRRHAAFAENEHRRKEGSKESEYKKGLRPVLWLSPNFPLRTEELLPLLDILANKVKAIRRLRDLLTTKLPPGTFPVKVAIPVVPTIRVLVTFTKFEELQPLEEFTTPPSSPDNSKSPAVQPSSSSWIQWIKAPYRQNFSTAPGPSSRVEDIQDPFAIPSDYVWTTPEEKKKKTQENKNKSKKGRNGS